MDVGNALNKIYRTLQPSQVKAPKWKPAAFSPHTLHRKFIYKNKQNCPTLDKNYSRNHKRGV